MSTTYQNNDPQNNLDSFTSESQIVSKTLHKLCNCVFEICRPFYYWHFSERLRPLSQSISLSLLSAIFLVPHNSFITILLPSTRCPQTFHSSSCHSHLPCKHLTHLLTSLDFPHRLYPIYILFLCFLSVCPLCIECYGFSLAALKAGVYLKLISSYEVLFDHTAYVFSQGPGVTERGEM